LTYQISIELVAAFFSDHSHCTDYNGQRSSIKKITASIIQGSGIGPAAYVVTAADLQVANAGNELVKFADDTYLIIPADDIHTRLKRSRTLKHGHVTIT